MSEPAAPPGLSASSLPDPPLKLAIIGGSGIGPSFSGNGIRSHEIDTPFGRPSGPIFETSLGGVPALLLARHGPGHVIPPSGVPFRANIFALRQLGATHVIATGAVGSLREEYRPRDLVIPDQIIDKTHGRPGTYYEGAAVHVEFAEPFCPVLRKILLDAAENIFSAPDEQSAPNGETAPQVHDGGCYVCMEGPAFSTRAESHMHRLWGGDLIGMTLMPEAKLAREAELPYAAICLVTDYDSWRPRPADAPVDPFALLEEIVSNLRQVSERAHELIRRAAELMTGRLDELSTCPARESLKLAIWTDRGRIDPAEVRRLWPLWGRYVEDVPLPPTIPRQVVDAPPPPRTVD